LSVSEQVKINDQIHQLPPLLCTTLMMQGPSSLYI